MRDLPAMWLQSVQYTHSDQVLSLGESFARFAHPICYLSTADPSHPYSEPERLTILLPRRPRRCARTSPGLATRNTKDLRQIRRSMPVVCCSYCRSRSHDSCRWLSTKPSQRSSAQGSLRLSISHRQAMTTFHPSLHHPVHAVSAGKQIGRAKYPGYKDIACGGMRKPTHT